MTSAPAKIHLFQWVVNIVTLIPGLVILRDQIYLPPGFSSGILGGLIEAIGAFIVLFSIVNKNYFQNLSLKRINTLSVYSFLLFIIGFFLYMAAIEYCVINSNNWGKDVLIPLWISDNKASDLIRSYGGIQRYYDDFGVDSINSLLRSQSRLSLYVTKIIIYLLFFMLFIGLIISFTILGIKYRYLNYVRSKS